jgi:hypothetical protein
MSITYSASSLEDIAKAVDLLKARAEDIVKVSTSRRKRDYYTGKAAAFSDVVEMLRATELKP